MEVLQTSKDPDHGNHGPAVSRPRSDTMYELVRSRRVVRDSERSTRHRHERSIDPAAMAAASALVRARQHARTMAATTSKLHSTGAAAPTAKEQWQRKFGNPRVTTPQKTIATEQDRVLETQSDVPLAAFVSSMYTTRVPHALSPNLDRVIHSYDDTESQSEVQSVRLDALHGNSSHVESRTSRGSPSSTYPGVSKQPMGDSMSSLSRSSARSVDSKIKRESNSDSIDEATSSSFMASSSATGTEGGCSASSSSNNEVKAHGVPNESFTDDSSPTNSVQSGLSCPSIVVSTSSSSPSSVVAVEDEESSTSKRSSGDSGIETQSSSGTTATPVENSEPSCNSLIDEAVPEPSLDSTRDIVASDDSGTLKTDDIDATARATIQAYIDSHVLADPTDPTDVAALYDQPAAAIHDTIGIAPSETFETKDIDPIALRRVRDYIDALPRTSSNATIPSKRAIDDSGSEEGIEHLDVSSVDLARGAPSRTSISDRVDVQRSFGESFGLPDIANEALFKNKTDSDRQVVKHATLKTIDAPASRGTNPMRVVRPVLSARGVDPPSLHGSVSSESCTLPSNPLSSTESSGTLSTSLSDWDSLWRDKLGKKSNVARAFSEQSTGRLECDANLNQTGDQREPISYNAEPVPLESKRCETTPSGERSSNCLGSLNAANDFELFPVAPQHDEQSMDPSTRHDQQITTVAAAHSFDFEQQDIVADTSIDVPPENETKPDADFLSIRQSTLRELNVDATVNHTDECLSVKEGSCDLEKLSAAIYGFLVETAEHSETELDSFVRLLRFSFLALMKGPTSSEVSSILNRAKKLNVSLAATDRLIDSSQAVHLDTTAVAENDLSFTGQGDDAKMQWFLRSLLRHFESSTAQLIDHVGKLNNYAHLGSRSDDTFEVEVNDGYARQEYAPKPDDEPWWKVAARLDNPLDQRDTESLNEVDDHEVSSAELPLSPQHDVLASVFTSVEDDIASHWKQREASRRLEPSTTKSKVGKTRDAILPKPSLRAGVSHVSFKSGLVTSKEEMTRMRKIQGRRDAMKRWQSRHNLVATPPLLKSINAVDCVPGLNRRKKFASQSTTSCHVWRMNYNERTGNHSGFIGIDGYSLVRTSSVQVASRSRDESPWESRAVKQRFLYEQSVTGRNWFGSLTNTRGNRKFKEPVCRPKSMEMPMEAGEWTEEWFKQSRLVPFDSSGAGDLADDLSDDETWEKTPECGTLRNERLKIGERISRVTPDLTSSLRRSRWRKKHFPQGTFPYK